jgi:putative NADH-flavin reductase
MKSIIIFGATGGTGTELVQQALAKNYSVTAFLRNPEKLNLKDDRLTIFKGNVLNSEDVEKAMEKKDVVLCTVGTSGMDKSFLRTKGTKNIVEAMEKLNIKRLICQSTLGFGDTKDVLPWHMKYIIVPLFIKNAFKDHEEQEKVIEQSNLDWIIARPASLTNGDKTGNYKVDFNLKEKIKVKISRADVADFMLNQIAENQYLHQKVVLSY